jgi:hypothetical protein
MASGFTCYKYVAPDGAHQAHRPSLAHSNQSLERRNQSLSQHIKVNKGEKMSGRGVKNTVIANQRLAHSSAVRRSVKNNER